MNRSVDLTRLFQHASAAAALSAAAAAVLHAGLMAVFGDGTLYGLFALYGAAFGLLVGPAVVLRERTGGGAAPLIALVTLVGCYLAYLQYMWLSARGTRDAVSAIGAVLAMEARTSDPIMLTLFFAPPAFAITWAVVRRDLEPDLRRATLRAVVATALLSLASVTFYDLYLLGSFEPGAFWVPWWVDARGHWATALGALGVGLAACLPAILALAERWVPLEALDQVALGPAPLFGDNERQ